MVDLHVVYKVEERRFESNSLGFRISDRQEGRIII